MTTDGSTISWITLKFVFNTERSSRKAVFLREENKSEYWVNEHSNIKRLGWWEEPSKIVVAREMEEKVEGDILGKDIYIYIKA